MTAQVGAATGGEAIVLSTCARLDVYAFGPATANLTEIVADLVEINDRSRRRRGYNLDGSWTETLLWPGPYGG